jgi:DNA-directed RNA polymerase alpha subunit
MQRDQTNAQAKMVELELKRELAMLQYANANSMKLEEVKARLAETAMKLNATKELAGMKASADLMPKPPIEPPGKAPAGQSFQK